MAFRKTRNFVRRIRTKPIGYVLLNINGKLPMVRESQSFIEKKVLPGPKYSFEELWNLSLLLLKEKRVKGLIVEFINLEGGLATLESLRDLILLWKKHERPVWFHSNNYSFTTYYLASAADNILLTKGGVLSTTGVSLTVSFMKEYLESKGIQTQIAQVSKYKSAMNALVYDELPDEQKAMLEWLRDTIFDKIRDTIADTREKTTEMVELLIDSSPITDKEAIDGGWVDGLTSTADLKSLLSERTGGKVNLIEFKEALGRIPTAKGKGGNVAILPAIGMIVDGESRSALPIPIPILGDPQLGDHSFNQSVRRVLKDKKIKAAVLMVDSGGGSATASESMLNELRRLSNKMPIVAYFNDVAGSGGYYIAMYAEKIVSQPLTITSSIGVLNGKISTDGVYEQRNIKRHNISRGKNANISNATGLWDEEQRKTIEKNMYRIYDLFKGHVARNRGKTLEEVEEFAGGRVFLGKQALDLGIVDQLGNLMDAVDLAAQLANLSKVKVKVIGKQKKYLTPESIEPKAVLRQLERMSGKSHLLPYVLIEHNV